MDAQETGLCEELNRCTPNDREPGKEREVQNFRSFYCGRFLLAEECYKPRVGHNDIDVRRQASPGYFIPLNWSELRKVYAFKGSHEVTFYSDSD